MSGIGYLPKKEWPHFGKEVMIIDWPFHKRLWRFLMLLFKGYCVYE